MTNAPYVDEVRKVRNDLASAFNHGSSVTFMGENSQRRSHPKRRLSER